MASTLPRLFADERGVWIEKTPGSSCGIQWNEVFSVSGHKLDGITEIYSSCVELDFEFGEYIQFYQDWPGFEQVIVAISQRLPGIATNWFQQIEQLGVGDAPVEVWRRTTGSN
jgi:hypothetical protein